ncbi:unnamed protein product [Brassica napus]|nr:unnamed protein product [Brassica napus]
MTGLEYVISDATEPNLFVFPKQKKDCPEKGRDIHNILMAFSADASKLETIRQVDAKNENEPSKTKAPNANTTSPSFLDSFKEDIVVKNRKQHLVGTLIGIKTHVSGSTFSDPVTGTYQVASALLPVTRLFLPLFLHLMVAKCRGWQSRYI